jgi:hypothetical protein
MPVLTFKVTAAEAAAIRARARAQRQRSLSAYLRGVALAIPAPAPRRVVLKKHPVSGLTYDASPGPMVTQEQIDAALADYP